MLKNFDSHEELDETTASQMLDNIFHACEVEPNSVPLSVLTSYSNYRTARYQLQKGLLGIVILLFCLMPLLFIQPKLSIDASATAPLGKPAYTLTVDTWIPIRKITASINGTAMPVYESGSHVYSIEPTQNGELVITVVLKNNQIQTMNYTVSGVDTKTPVLVSSHYEDGQIILVLSDEESGIDFDNIYGVTNDAETLYPIDFNREDNTVVFDCPVQFMNIYVPDLTGNTLQLLLTIQ